MTQKSIKFFINEYSSKPPKKNYSTKKTKVYHNEDIWSINKLDLRDYGPENNGSYSYVLVIIDNFSKFGGRVSLKNKKAQTMKETFEKIITNSKPSLNETDRGKEFYNKIFQSFLDNNNIKIYSRNPFLGAVFAERFNRTIRDLLKRPVFERRDGNWVDVLLTKTKQCNKRTHSSTKLTPKQACLKKNERYVYKKLLDKKIIQPKFQIDDLVRTADFKKKTFSKGDTTSWPYQLYKISEINNDTKRVIDLIIFKKR